MENFWGPAGWLEKNIWLTLLPLSGGGEGLFGGCCRLPGWASQQPANRQQISAFEQYCVRYYSGPAQPRLVGLAKPNPEPSWERLAANSAGLPPGDQPRGPPA